MERTITVKGTGHVSLRPDLIVVRLDVTSKAARYEETMQQAATALARLKRAIEQAGFAHADLKTSDFSVNTDYERYKDKDGEYHSRFVGYVCEQRTKLEFALDAERLSRVIVAISDARAEPKLAIEFTVKDKAAIQDALLVSAAENAKKRATLLATGAGGTLGTLQKIDYTWGEIHLISPTRVAYSHDLMSSEASFDFEPETIDASDTATFVWSLV